ncbi:MAG TPA: HD domain-containing protein [Spirochaetota bacterium]|nr:HD domain-containing protein [Spirochaetota bacterium]
MTGETHLSSEEQVIHEAERLLSGKSVTHDGYAALLEQYRKLARQTEKLVRISDRQQEQLNRVNEELAEKNSILADREAHLVKLVDEKTQKIERITIALVNALEDANLLNDADTGNHIKRVSKYSAVIARAYGCAPEYVRKIELYASLHDIGKVGIPDEILKKRGSFEDDEFERMKQHVLIGFRMLDSEDLDAMAKNIVRYHHEKWDGTGYIEGLAGETIPLEARIVALADVYDALTSRRAYKPAYCEKETEDIIRAGAGKHFDPAIVDVFFTRIESIISIRDEYT